MRAVMNICDRIYVLHHGEIIFSGTPDEVKASETVLKAYLGKRMASENTLTVRKLSVSYWNRSRHHRRGPGGQGGSIVSLIGANGAGKIDADQGHYRAGQGGRGEIHLWRQAASNRRTLNVILGHGVALVPEGRRLFGSMTVRGTSRWAPTGSTTRAGGPSCWRPACIISPTSRPSCPARP